MATLKPLVRPLLRPPNPTSLHVFQRRTFLPNPFATNTSHSSEPQVLTASRTLLYPSAPVYSIIADVPSYSSFLPYCQRSSITKWSAPDATYQRRWPSEGILTSGFGGINESFASRVYCVPGRVVESIGGDAETSLSPQDIQHHLSAPDHTSKTDREPGSTGLLTHLRSTWTVQEEGNARTRVSLRVEFAFTNPFYAALSGNVAPKVAGYMVQAFEKRVSEILQREPEMMKASLGEMEGSRLKR